MIINTLKIRNVLVTEAQSRLIALIVWPYELAAANPDILMLHESFPSPSLNAY